jgi:hypothetical protein
VVGCFRCLRGVDCTVQSEFVLLCYSVTWPSYPSCPMPKEILSTCCQSRASIQPLLVILFFDRF